MRAFSSIFIFLILHFFSFVLAKDDNVPVSHEHVERVFRNASVIIIYKSTVQRVPSCRSLYYNKCSNNRECCSKLCLKTEHQVYGICIKNENDSRPIGVNGSNKNRTLSKPVSVLEPELESGFRPEPVSLVDPRNKITKTQRIKTTTTTTTTPAPRIVGGFDKGDEEDFEVERCGIPIKAITNVNVVGGEDASEGQFPWIVSVQKRKDNKEFRHYCGGVLINKEYVLSAAHCYGQEDKYRAVVNAVDLQKVEKNQTFEVVKIISHPNYKQKTGDNDIALLKLKQQVEDVSPICLPAKNQLDSDTVTVAGWGRTSENDGRSPDILQHAKLQIIQWKQCKKRYGIRITKNMFCAGGGSQDSCSGDSGGPLMKEYDNVYYVSGIVSFGIGCGRVGNPGIYTMVSNYIDWIENEIKTN